MLKSWPPQSGSYEFEDTELWCLGVQNKHRQIPNRCSTLQVWHVSAYEALYWTCWEQLPPMQRCESSFPRCFERTPPSQAVFLSLLHHGPTNSSFSAVQSISLVQLDTLCLILTKQQSVVKAFLRSADRKNLLSEVDQICKLSEYPISLDTQNVYSLLLLIVITLGNFTFSCHEMAACSRKNMWSGILVLLQMTVQGQQLASAEENCIKENFTVFAIKRALPRILVAVFS